MFWMYYLWAPVAVLLAGTLAVVGLGLILLLVPGVGFHRPVDLDCPHCGEPTPANRPTCRVCGKSFRDRVARRAPPA